MVLISEDNMFLLVYSAPCCHTSCGEQVENQKRNKKRDSRYIFDEFQTFFINHILFLSLVLLIKI